MDIGTLLHDLIFDYTLRTVALGAGVLGIVSGALGSFAVLRRQSLLGDAMSHAALPGIVISFLITRSKAPLPLMLGALVAGWLGTLAIMSIVRTTRIKYDSALGFVLSVFFGAGLMLLTFVQRLPDARQAGLDTFLFGQAAALLQRDVITMSILGGAAICILALFWKEFKLLSFDIEFGASVGFPMRLLDILLTTLIVVAIVIGLQAVGVVLTYSSADASSGIDTTAAKLSGGNVGNPVEVQSGYVITSAGVYTLTVTATDLAGNVEIQSRMFTVYDPTAGFVTGGGWITSPAGAYLDDPSLGGKATFGFVSRYKKGANVPTGKTQFKFNAAGLDFESVSYEWLVVAGNKAQFKGTGTINGAGDYAFFLTAVDGDGNGGTGVDRFRIRIWDRTSGGLIYDSQVNAPDDADPATALGGGNIVIHA